MLLSILSVSVGPREMPWTEAALALAPLCGDLKLENLLRPLLLIWVFNKFVLNPVLPLSFYFERGQT